VKRTASVCLVVLSIASFATRTPAATPAATCAAAKHKASGRWLDRTLGCLARVARSGNGVASDCLSRYDATLATSWLRAEDRGGCAGAGDLQAASGTLDACVALVRNVTDLNATSLPPTRCGGDKLRASGKRLKADLACHAKAIQGAVPVSASCLDSSRVRFDNKFVKADGLGDCIATGDAGLAATAAAMCVVTLLDQPAPPPEPTCLDGVRNGTEADVDCGGGACPACADGRVCGGNGDCASGRCVSGRCAPPDASPVCTRWLADRASLTEGTWSGNAATCSAGDVSAAGRASALRSMNLYRWLAGLPPVADDPVKNQRAQQCALIMHANARLSHSPPSSWACWTQAGADGAGSSNIATAPGVRSVDLYMYDPGNPTSIGHRRWILSNWLDTVGLGSTSSYSCMSIAGNGSAGRPWLAWPPPGTIPFAATRNGDIGSVDVTGWTVQSDTIDLGAATVTVREDGVVRPVTVTQLGDWFGSQWAIRFNPSGWQSAAGRTYQVTVGNVATPIQYAVTLVSCP
jgi:hypothetical protein